MRRSLERSDTLINLRNQEIAALNSRLAAKEETIAEAAEQFDRLDQEVTQLRSQLATERAGREEAEKKLEELQENSEIDFDFAGKAGELVSWLRKTVGKSLPKQVTVKEIQKILEGGDN